MKLPSQIAVPESRDDITQEVKRLLRAADVNGRIPTPRADILACAQLVESGELDLSTYEESFRTKALGFLHKAIGKVFGYLDFRAKEIYVDPKIHPSKRNFITYHEVTHKILDWQRVIYTQEDHSTLSPECKSIFESEANYGAAEILFQCEKLEEMALDYNISVASVLELANHFDASAHSTMRRFVERHRQPCLVLVLKPTKLEHVDGILSYVVCYSIASIPFLTKFGEPFRNRFINPGDQLCDIVNKTRQSDSIWLKDINGSPHEFTVEPFDSGYRQFALISPAVKKRSRIVARLHIVGQ